AEKPRLLVERADLLQRRFPLHHDARLAVQFWPETQQRLRGKLPGIKTGVEFRMPVHRAPTHAARLCQIASLALCGGLRKGMTLVDTGWNRSRTTSTRYS